MKYRRFLLAIITLLGILGASFLYRPQAAEACCISLNPNPSGFVPNYILNELRTADDADNTPKFVLWISKQAPPSTNYANQDVQVDADNPNSPIALSFSYAGAVGFTPSQATMSRAKVVGAPPSASNIIGKTITLDWKPNYNSVGTYRHGAVNFSFLPPGGFTKSGTYSMAIVIKHVNEFTRSNGSKVYQCVVPVNGAAIFVNSLNDVDNCPPAGVTLSINVTIIDQRYDHRAELRLGAGSPTGGEVSPGQQYKLYPRVTNVGSGPTVGYHLMAVRNQDPDFVANTAIGDLSPASDRADIFGVQKSYSTNNNACSSANNTPKDCWSWVFQTVSPNANVNADFTFRVRADAPDGEQVCFLPFVRRQSASVLYHNGDQVCFTVRNNPICAVGTDFAGQPIASQPDRNGDGVVDALDCNIPPDQTYLRVYGNDIQAGGGFAPDCTVTNQNAAVEGFSNSTTLGGSTTWKGSSGQFAVSALGVVDGFFSSNLRGAESTTDFARPPVGQTFGNTTNMTNKVGVGDGGDSGVKNCIPDYLGDAPVETGSNVISTRNVSGKQALFFEGRDVFITGTGITFQGADTGWNTIEDIPSFYLVVKGGNIYIDPSVTRLDGVYIAQPAADGTKGEIITCATAAGVVPAHGGCGQQLVINGAFIARQVQFKRVFGKLTEATAGESVTDTKAAEVFNFSPEVYLSPLNDELKRSIPFTKYDYITSLPPIL